MLPSGIRQEGDPNGKYFTIGENSDASRDASGVSGPVLSRIYSWQRKKNDMEERLDSGKNLASNGCSDPLRYL